MMLQNQNIMENLSLKLLPQLLTQMHRRTDIFKMYFVFNKNVKSFVRIFFLPLLSCGLNLFPIVHDCQNV